jgi:murein DD-endopeptidase MepM/ murein hydrolase activator NlpD
LADLGVDIDWNRKQRELLADMGQAFGSPGAPNPLNQITGGSRGMSSLDMITGSATFTPPFAQFYKADNTYKRWQAAAAANTTPKDGSVPGTVVPGTINYPSGGAYDTDRDKFEIYRASIVKYAQANNIDPDALAAILFIKTDGGTGGVTAGSPKGAYGLGQHMPGTWAGLAEPGDDINNPEHQIKNAAKYYAQLYKQFGDYGLAAAAYQGGPGAIVNGKPRSDIDDGNMTPAQYAALWQEYYQGIKTRAPKPAPSGSPTVNANGYTFPVADYTGKIELHHGADMGAADLFAPEGTTILAMRGGQVIDQSYNNLGGWTITIQGDDGLTYYYAHMQGPAAAYTGDRVAAGQRIGAVGDTGNAKGTGAHLHLGIGYGIASGAGARGGAGNNYNATALLQQVFQNQYARPGSQSGVR